MSRHDLQPKSGLTDIIKATVGWDRPLQTFFAQVFTRAEAEDEDGDATIWIGTEPGELPTPEAAIAVVAPYAVIPDGLVEQLNAEMKATIGIVDGEYQARAKRRLFGSIH